MARRHKHPKSRSKSKNKRSRRSEHRRERGAREERGPRNKWATDRDPPRGTCLLLSDEGEVLEARDSTQTTLALAGDRAGEEWLWCLHCERFFQAKHLRLDFLGNWGQCPFEDCGAAGLDIDIFTWDECRYDDPEWPRSVEALTYGMRFPPRLVN